MDWGDGQTGLLELPAGSTGFDQTHIYEQTGIFAVREGVSVPGRTATRPVKDSTHESNRLPAVRTAPCCGPHYEGFDLAGLLEQAAGSIEKGKEPPLLSVSGAGEGGG